MTNNLSDKAGPDFVSRINRVISLCNVQYDNSTLAWINSFDYAKDFIKDKDIFEIGYGYFGGLADFVLKNGARSYVGVDIDALAVKLSKEIHPEINYMWEDPVYVLNNLDKFDLNDPKKQYACISSGVIDKSILKYSYYVDELIESIGRVTPIGGYSVHSAGMIRKDFDKYFEKYGFIPLNVDSADCFEVYKRIN